MATPDATIENYAHGGRGKGEHDGEKSDKGRSGAQESGGERDRAQENARRGRVRPRGGEVVRTRSDGGGEEEVRPGTRSAPEKERPTAGASDGARVAQGPREAARGPAGVGANPPDGANRHSGDRGRRPAARGLLHGVRSGAGSVRIPVPGRENAPGTCRRWGVSVS